MAQAVAAIAGGLLNSTANSKGDTNSSGAMTANNSIVSNPQQNAPEIKQADVEKAADPVETKEEPKREPERPKVNYTSYSDDRPKNLSLVKIR